MEINYDIGNFFDEMFSETGVPRPHYQNLVQRFSTLSKEEFLMKRDAVDLSFLHQGITFTVYGDEESTEKIFPFDLIPRIIPNSEWQAVELGLEQRIQALNLFLKDIYTDQKIVKDKILPQEILNSAKHFRKEFIGVKVPKDIYIHICGSDLIRDIDGNYLVLEDNARCPSGASYMLENRNAFKRAFPNFFQNSSVRSVLSYPRDLLAALKHIAPEGKDNPCVAVLTPGPYNSAYYEHCFLARQMGVDIVEGRDLIVDADDKVYMRTTDGMKQVDVLYRRIDDDFIDPEVFRKDSMLGVPGLMRAYCKGNIGLANSVGTGIADDKVVYNFVPDMIRYYLDQEPILQNVQTWLPYREADLKYTLENLENLVVKAANEAGGYGMLIGPHATKKEIESFREQIKADPRLADMILVRNSRLSVQPVTPQEWRIVCELGKTDP